MGSSLARVRLPPFFPGTLLVLFPPPSPPVPTLEMKTCEKQIRFGPPFRAPLFFPSRAPSCVKAPTPPPILRRLPPPAACYTLKFLLRPSVTIDCVVFEIGGALTTFRCELWLELLTACGVFFFSPAFLGPFPRFFFGGVSGKVSRGCGLFDSQKFFSLSTSMGGDEPRSFFLFLQLSPPFSAAIWRFCSFAAVFFFTSGVGVSKQEFCSSAVSQPPFL